MHIKIKFNTVNESGRRRIKFFAYFPERIENGEKNVGRRAEDEGGQKPERTGESIIMKRVILSERAVIQKLARELGIRF